MLLNAVSTAGAQTREAVRISLVRTRLSSSLELNVIMGQHRNALIRLASRGHLSNPVQQRAAGGGGTVSAKNARASRV